MKAECRIVTLKTGTEPFVREYDSHLANFLVPNIGIVTNEKVCKDRWMFLLSRKNCKMNWCEFDTQIL